MSFEDKGYFRRKFPRRAFNRRVGVLSHGSYFLADSAEIGEGGMSILLPEELEEGNQLVVNIRIPGGDFVSLRAQVRSRRPNTDGNFIYGLSFTNIPFSQKRQIRSYVSARTGNESLIM
jgi:c-di-GMP-binding flagellar brake protein YcgR